MKPRIKLIANPVAGRKAGEKIKEVVRWFEDRGVHVDLSLTSARGDARRMAASAAKQGYYRIVAAGGDGTLNEVVNGMAGAETPLAFIPLGTTNVFAYEAGIPFDMERACRIALDGDARPVSLGRAGTDYFLLMAGVGFDGEVVHRVNGRLKRFTGKFAYALSALYCLARLPLQRIEVRCDEDVPMPCHGVILSNGRFYGGKFVVNPEASLRTEQLDLCLFLSRNRLALAASFALLALGKKPPMKFVRHLQARKVEVRGAETAVQIDGDDFGRIPMNFYAEPGKLTLVFPPLR